MSGAPEIVKLFVSSTFEDLHAERDRLARFVFPRVRERCRAIGVEFVAVDLRWGVTREDTQRHDTAELCMREVDRCRPFFIGLIGDRYGWVPAPQSVPPGVYREAVDAAGDADRALLERAYALDETTGEPVMRLVRDAVADDEARLRVIRLWQDAGLPRAGKSLTEIEIDRALAAGDTRALFYLREPVHLHPGFPRALLPVFTSPDGEPRRRLASLKERLGRHPGARGYAPAYAGMRVESTYLPKGLSGPERRALEDGVLSPEELEGLTERLRRVVERHARVALDGLDAWGEQVAEDLWALIEGAAGPPAVRADGRGHERFLRDRARLFVGREDLVERAVAFAAADEPDDMLVFTGPPGSGKSALMAECAGACRRACAGAAVLPHFIGAAPGSTDLGVTIRSLCERLRDECGLDDELPESADALEFALAGFLEHAAAKRRVVVFVDALNQLDPAGGSHDLRWLPARLPPDVRVVVSTLPGAPLERLRERLPPERVIELPPLPASDREELIRRTLAERGKRLSAGQLERLLDTRDRPDAVRPLYLLVALEELSVFGDFEGLDRRIARLPERLEELFDQVLARLELDHGRPLTEAVLRLLAAARSGLLEPEIRDLLGERGITPLAWSRLRLALDFYLRPVDERDEGLTGFYHDGLRQAVERRYGDAGAAHRELARYFAGRARGGDGWDAAAARPLSELLFHHVRGGLATEAARVLEDPGFLEARLRAGPAAALLADFDLLLAAGGPGIDAPGLGWIRDALRLSAHLLARDPGELGSQLWARLAARASPSVDALRTALSADRRRPWLRPYSTPLTAAGSPLLTTLSGMNSINWVVVTPDGSLALCCDDDSIFWIWDLRSGLVRRQVKARRSSWIMCGAGVPGRALGVAGVTDGGVLVVDVDAGEVVAKLPSADALQAIAVSPDGREVWTAHDLGRVQVRPLEGRGKPRTVDVGMGDVSAIAAVAPGRACIAVAGRVQEWDLEAGTCLRTLGEVDGGVLSLAVSHGGDRLAAGSDDGRIDLWELEDGAHAALPGHRDRAARNDVKDLAFTPDGRLVSGSSDRTVRVWSGAGEPLATLRGHSMAVYALDLFHGGRRAVSASKDGTLRVWDLEAEPVPEPDFVHPLAVDALAVRGGIAVSGGRDRRIGVWELETGRPLAHWDAHGGREVHEGWVAAVALDPDGQTVRSAAADGTLKSWAVDGTPVDAVEGDWGTSRELALARDVPLLAAGDQARVSFWRPGRTTRLGRAKLEQTHAAIGISSDGRTVLAADVFGGLAVIDARTRRVLWSKEWSWESRDYAEDVAISQDGRWAVVGMSNGRVELWDLERRRKRRSFKLHSDRAWTVAISPDGALGCSAGWDRLLRVWKLRTGDVIASYSSDDAWEACVFADDSRRVVASDDRGLHFLALENV